MKEIHDGAQLYAVIHSTYNPQGRIWDTHPFITMFSYLQEAGVRLFCDEDQHLFSERNGKTSPALLQGMIDMCQARIAAALKQSKQNIFQQNTKHQLKDKSVMQKKMLKMMFRKN